MFTFSKILGKVVLSRLIDNLKHNGLLTSHQHGITKNRSTTTAIMHMIEPVSDKLEDGCMAADLFLDLSKAFDCYNKLITTKLKVSNW